MPPEKLPHYLRTFRKRVGLSQEEVAWLMGSANDSKVSRHERFEDEPSLESILAYEIIYGRPARKLFAGIFEAVQLVVRRRARVLIWKLERGEGDAGAAAKLAALRPIAESGGKMQADGDHA